MQYQGLKFEGIPRRHKTLFGLTKNFSEFVCGELRITLPRWPSPIDEKIC